MSACLCFLPCMVRPRKISYGALPYPVGLWQPGLPTKNHVLLRINFVFAKVGIFFAIIAKDLSVEDER